MLDASQAEAPAATPYPEPDGRLGLYPGNAFRVIAGDDPDAPIIPSARFLFAQELVAVPAPQVPATGFAHGIAAMDDVRQWAATDHSREPPAYPPLVWIASPGVARHAHMSPDGGRLMIQGGSVPLRLHDRLPLNGSWFDASSAAFFAQRPLLVRGVCDRDGFIARSLWPEDCTLDLDRAQPLNAEPGRLGQRLREHVRLPTARFETRMLWQRDGTDLQRDDRPVIAVMLNGAQADDDEAWGGHIAVGTGLLRAGGALDDWLINNFYTPDSYSEKGIIAAPVTLDRYQADLNSGQGWYRPSWMLVAVLRDARAAHLVQGAFNRVYQQFWRHQLAYQHATMNCTGITVDVLRATGLRVRSRGPSTRLGAWLAIPHALIKHRSEERARLAYEYLTEDQTRLFPAAAFEEIADELIALGRNATEPQGPLASLLAQDLDALALIDLPQLPSSRRSGSWPVATAGEFHRALPRDDAKLQIIPVPPRPFPDGLRDADLLPPKARRSDWPLAVWCAISIVGLPYLLWRVWRALRARGGAPPAKATDPA